jgi:lipoprotein-anchoring transpeptidase ErfK/SrfK
VGLSFVGAPPSRRLPVGMRLAPYEDYGIHGTSAPETIGYAASNGCVRLTNWDAAPPVPFP